MTGILPLLDYRLFWFVPRLVPPPHYHQTTALPVPGVFRRMTRELFLSILGEGRRVTYPLSLYWCMFFLPEKCPWWQIFFFNFKDSWKLLRVHAPQGKNLCWWQTLERFWNNATFDRAFLESSDVKEIQKRLIWNLPAPNKLFRKCKLSWRLGP